MPLLTLDQIESRCADVLERGVSGGQRVVHMFRTSLR